MTPGLQLLNSARLIATGRFLLAELLIFFAVTTGPPPGAHTDWDNVLTLAYLLIAFALVLVAWKSWWLDFVLFPASFGIDLLAFLVLPLFLAPAASSRAVAGVALASFILLCSAVRWGTRTTFAMAIALNLLGMAIALVRDGFVMPGIHLGDPMDLAGEMRSIMLLAIVSIFIVWAGLRLADPRHAKFVPSHPGIDLPLLTDALEYAMTVTGARGGAIAWTRNEATEGTILRRGTLGWESTATAERWRQRSGEAALLPTLFDLVHGRAIALHTSGRIAIGQNAPAENAFLHDLGARTGISLPIYGAAGAGRLVLTNVPLMSWDHLRLAAAIADEIAHGIDRQEFEAAARDAALVHLRRSVARDLHDSVAQSLAGARFWLQALRTRGGMNADIVAEMDKIQTALDSESTHIGALIDELRRDDDEVGERNLASDLEALLAGLSLHWRVEIHLADGAPMAVPYRLCFEIQQIVREATANAVRHGQATRIDVLCEKSWEVVRFVVQDNGKGFVNGGVAPTSISERVATLGGSLNVTSTPGDSRIDVSLPTGA